MKNQFLIIILILAGSISIGLSYALSNLPSTGYPDDVRIGLGNKLYLDNGSSNYFQMPYSNTIRAFSGGTAMMDITINGVHYYGNLYVLQGNRLYLDGGDDNYFQMPYSNTIRAFVGDTPMMDVAINGIHYYGNLYVLPRDKLYLDGGNNNYLQIPSSNQVAIFSNGVQTLTANNGSVGINTANPQQALDVSGNIRTTGNLTTAAAKEFTITAPSGIPICIGTGC